MLAFAREGAKVVVADVDVAGGEETTRLPRDAGGEALLIKTDVPQVSEIAGTEFETGYAENNQGGLYGGEHAAYADRGT